MQTKQPENQKMHTHTHSVNIRNNKRAIMIWYLVRATNDEMETFFGTPPDLPLPLPLLAVTAAAAVLLIPIGPRHTEWIVLCVDVAAI